VSAAQTVAVVVAAGSGTRFGGDEPKQLVRLGGVPIVRRAVDAVAASGVVERMVVVTRADLVAPVTAVLAGQPLVSAVVAGGETRADSVRAALAFIDGADDDRVVVHDAARPLVPPGLVTATVAALDHHSAVTVAVPLADTVIAVTEAAVVGVPDRRSLQRAQTPQAFHLGVLRRAHDLAAADPAFSPTDDCGVVHRFLPEVVIGVLPGSERNLKITTQLDLEAAARLLAAGSEEA
jgi:2-C-methyl-D-erythritol 4-phosphate cytidylyltransferase